MNSKDGKASRNADVLDITRKVCAQLSIAFSANDANQSMADLTASRETGKVGLLNAVGQRVGLGFREVEGDFRDLVVCIYETAPVIVARSSSENPDDPDYFLIIGKKGRSGFMVQIDGQEKKVSRRWLNRNALRSEDGSFRWLLVQPVFAADAASAYNYHTGEQGEPLSPLRRFLAFLQPESHDIRTVFIFAVFVGILSLTTPLAVEALVNTIAFGRYLQPLIVLSLIVFVFLAFRAGLGVLMTIVVEVIQRRLFIRVVDDLSVRLTHVPIPHLNKYYGPELVNRFFDVVNVQKITSKLLLESLMLVLQTLIGLTVLAFYHPFLLGYDIGLITLMIIVLFVMGRGAIKTAQKESALKYETAAWLQEIVRHPTTFKFNGGLGFAVNRADELAARYIQCRTDHFRILIRQTTFSMLMQAVAATVLLGLGGYLVIEGEMTLGQLVAAELIVTMILSSFAKVGKELESFYDLMASVDKLGKLFDLPGDPPNRLLLSRQQGPATVEFVDIKFKRGSSQRVSASIPAGNTLAIVGPAGSGKTKAIETVAGVQPPVDGYALLNNYRVDLIGAESLQRQIGFINNIEIFEGTVDENLRLGRSEIDTEAINEILEKLGLQETLTGLEKGLKTRLSVSGYPLSSGQAIRLVLARALIARPSLLLIDSLLDRLADSDLEDVLHRLNDFRSATTIVIATGRRAIAAWADQRLDAS